jgi:hypothetical protein
MATISANQTGGGDLLNQAAQQRLQARVVAAGGDIAAVVGEVRVQLDALDQAIANHPETSGRLQADRAFFVAQLAYLNAFARAAARPEQPRERGWLARLRSAFGRRRVAQ